MTIHTERAYRECYSEGPITVDQLPSQTVSRWSSLTESQFDEAALTRKQAEQKSSPAYFSTSDIN